MRQIAPKKKAKQQVAPQSSSPEKPKRRNSRSTSYVSPFKHPTSIHTHTSSVTPTNFNSKRLRSKAARASDPPGAKRIRAMQSVNGYVQRHYTAIGMAWPPVRPTRDDTYVPEEDENVGSRYRRRPEKKRHGYHDNGVVGGGVDGGVYRPGCSLSFISQAAAILAGAHAAYDHPHGTANSGAANGSVANGAWRGPNEGSKYGSTEAGNALSLLAEVIAGGRMDGGVAGPRGHHPPPQSCGQGSTDAATTGSMAHDSETTSRVACSSLAVPLKESSFCPESQPRDVNARGEEQIVGDKADVGEAAERIKSNPVPQANPAVSPLPHEMTTGLLFSPSPTIVRALPCPTPASTPASVVTFSQQSESIEKTAMETEPDGCVASSATPDTVAASPPHRVREEGDGDVPMVATLTPDITTSSAFCNSPRGR